MLTRVAHVTVRYRWAVIGCWLVLVVVGTIASQFVPPLSVERLQALFSRQRTWVQVGLLGFALLGITTYGPVGVAPFIYYRF